MTAQGQSRRFRDLRVTSAYPPRAATKRTWKHFAFVPIPDSCSAANNPLILSPHGTGKQRRPDGDAEVVSMGRRFPRCLRATHEEGGTGNFTVTGRQSHGSFIFDGLFNATLHIRSLVLIHIGRAHHALAHHIEYIAR